jgi:hypothetical protein
MGRKVDRVDCPFPLLLGACGLAGFAENSSHKALSVRVKDGWIERESQQRILML